MKKLSPYVKFPLILGVTCLVCGGALAGVNVLTKPVIAENEKKKADKAVFEILGKDNIETIEDAEITAPSSNIIKVRKVTLKSGNIAYYYELITSKGYSGTVTFGTAFDDSGCLGYYFISGTEDTVGLNVAKDNKAWNDALLSYKGDSSSFSFTGGSAQVTIPVIRGAVDSAYADYQAKHGVIIDNSLIKFTGGRLIQNDPIWEYRLTAVNKNSDYGRITLQVRLNMESKKVTKVEVIDVGGATEDYGKDLLEKGEGGQLNAAAKDFYKKFIGFKTSAAIPFDEIMAEGAPDPQDDTLEGANSIFVTGASYTARSVYGIIKQAVKMALADDPGSFDYIKTAGYVVSANAETGTKTYRVFTQNEQSKFGTMAVDVTVNPTDQKVVGAKVYRYYEATYKYGYMLIENGDSFVESDGAKYDFYNNYVKIPTGGLDFSVFSGDSAKDVNKPSDWSFFETGATYSAKAYYSAVQTAVIMAEKGEDGTEVDLPKSGYISVVEKNADGSYHVELTNEAAPTGWNKVKADITLDLAAKKVTKITVDAASVGNGGYGDGIFNGNFAGVGANAAKAEEFYNRYVKVPSTGLAFEIFQSFDPASLEDLTDKDGADLVNSTGATYSANNYMAAVNAVIRYAMEVSQNGN